MYHLYSRFSLLTLMLTLVFTAGCGTAEYEALMAERLVALKRQSRFDLLYQPKQLKRMALPSHEDEPEDGPEDNPEDSPEDSPEDGIERRYPITMRWPKLFTGERHWFVEGSEDHDGRTISSERLTPPFLDRFPGFLLMGEAGAKHDENEYLKYYCYLGVVETAETSADSLQAQLSEQINADKNVSIDQPWHTVELDRPIKGTVRWKHLRASGLQLFERVRRMRHRGKKVRRNGTFDIYLHEHQQFLVLWAVRIPAEIADQVNLLDVAEATAGSIVFDRTLLNSQGDPPDAAANDKPSSTE